MICASSKSLNVQVRQTHGQNGEGNQPRWTVTLAAAAAAFAAYTAMYAFRRPFTAGTYDGLTAFGADYKGVAVAVQILGYMASKFLGIKVVSEAPSGRRAALILGLVGCAAVGLLLFAVLPAPWNLAGIFLNGLPLGMIWGLIFRFLEGRRVTEVLGLGLSLSVIFSSGWVKSAGRGLITVGVPEFWMPLVTGLLFVPMLLIAVRMLASLPPPDAADRAARSPRQPMDGPARRAFLREWWPGILLLTVAYVCLMTYRDVRDSFMIDVLHEQGVKTDDAVFAKMENMVGLLVVVSLVWLRWVRDNRRALLANAAMIVAGPIIAAAGTWFFQRGILSSTSWLVVTGFGTYLAFVPFQTLFFDRLFAILRPAGTAAFLTVFTDAFGYLSTVAVYCSRFFGELRVPWSNMLVEGSYAQALLVTVCVVSAVWWFLKAERREPVRGT